MKDDRLKIAINCRHWIPGKMEGFGRYISEIAPRLARIMPDAKFYWIFDRKPSKLIPEFPNVRKIIVPPPARTTELIRCWNDLSVKLFLLYRPVDLYFSPDNHLSLTSSTRQVITVHDVNFMIFPDALPQKVSRFYHKRTPLYLSKATHILTVSVFSKNEILRFFPSIPSEKISVIYNGISNHFKPLTPEEIKVLREKYTCGQPYFFVLGSLHERKNLQRTLDAFNIFRQHYHLPWFLVITGRPLWKHWSLHVPEEIKAHVVFTGYIADEEVGRLMGASHALVFCSMYEGFGLPLAEAFACHVPAITSNNSALAEIGSRGALLVDPHSPAKIAEAMLKLASDSTLHLQLTEEAKQQKKYFSWERASEQISSLFYEITNKSI